MATSIAALTVGTLLLGASCASAHPRAGQSLTAAAGPWEVQVLVDGVPTETFGWQGGTYVLGRQGERYTVRVLNHGGRRIEAVVSIDGRDVVDGKPADFQKRGYLVPAWGSVDIDGWRLSESQAAAFRFSSVGASYAARTGSARDVGVVGVAIFPERVLPPKPVLRAYPPRLPYRDGASDDRAPAASSAPARADKSDALAESAAPAPAPANNASGLRAESAAEPRGGSGANEGRAKAARPGLGTAFGETVASEIQEVTFTRASQAPAALLGMRYNDREGLLAMGIDVDHAGPCPVASELDLRQSASPFPGERRYAQPPAGWRPSCPVRY